MADGRGRARGRMSAEPARRPTAEAPQLQGAWAARAAAAAAPPVEDGRPGRSAALQRIEQSNPTGGIAAGRGRGRGRRNESEARIVTLPNPNFIKYGKEGPVLKELYSNFFEVTNAPDIMLYQYHVDFVPELGDVRLQKSLFRQHGSTIGKYIFSGTELFTPVRLPQPYEVVSMRNSDNTLIQIKIRLIKEVHSNDDVYNQIMNVILRKCLEMLDLVQIRHDFYDKQAARPVHTKAQEKLEIWPGYLTTIKFHETKMLLNVDVISKQIRLDTVADQIISLQTNPDRERVLKEKLVSQIVMTKYNDRTYRIDDVDFEKNAWSTFHLRKENRDISYADYYRTRYNITLRYPDMPLLVSKPTKRDFNRGDKEMVLLIPELSSLTGITDDMRKNFNLMRDIVAAKQTNPSERVETMMKFMQRMKGREQIARELKDWGLNFSGQLIKVDNGRRLHQERIVQGDRRFPVNPARSDWSQQCRDSKMAVAAKLQKWFVVCPLDKKPQAFGFVQKIIETGFKMGFFVEEPKFVDIDSDRTGDYMRALDNECSRNDYNMVMLVFSSKNNSAEKYSAVKNKTCVNLGIPCQVITAGLWGGSRERSCATKVMIQMAAKLGAEPWTLDLPRQNWMVCGYDTYHDKYQRRAVGAFVASTNSTFTRYMSSVQVHDNNEEISINFQMFMMKALRKYRQVNNALPGRIFIYRDGIGAGDIERVKSIEVSSAKNAIQNAGTALGIVYDPGLAYIIVSKRINTRFFVKNNFGYENPAPGVVIDNTVTLSERFDFFLVSQSVNQGTVSPTSYHVIEDTSGTTPDIHQRLAYGLTHLYYNWAGTLSVPAPCQYAHKLAYLVGESQISGDIKEQLEHLPYYL